MAFILGEFFRGCTSFDSQLAGFWFISSLNVRKFLETKLK